MTVAGAVTGCWAAAIARQYARLLHGGAFPHARTLLAACCQTMQQVSTRIIWARACIWPDRYTVTVTVCGGLVGGLFAYQLPHLYWPAWMLGALLLVMGLLASIDAHTRLLPDALTLPLLWSGMVAAWLGAGMPLVSSFEGVVAGYALPMALRMVWMAVRGVDPLGGGDIKLLAGMGAWLGAHDAILVFLLACVTGSLYAIVRWRARAWRISQPFGPFIIAHAMLFLLWPEARGWLVTI